MKVYSSITVCILILLSKEVKPSPSEKDSSSEETFLYFAYGSNLLAKRIHINNPSAKFFSIAKLAGIFNKSRTFETYGEVFPCILVSKSRGRISRFYSTLDARRSYEKRGALQQPDYKKLLMFPSAEVIVLGGFTERSLATDYAWKPVFGFATTNRHIGLPPCCPKQEDVNHGTYQVRNVSVQTPGGKIFMARTYQMTVDPNKIPVKDLPPERQPSITYMKVILDGALESGLPMDYIRFLLTFPTNGKLASCDAQEQLGQPCNVEEST